MSWIPKLARKLEPYAIHRLPIFIAAGQSFFLLTDLLRLIHPSRCILVPDLVLQGEWWRLITYALQPAVNSGTLGLVFTVFSIYLIYVYGTVLESVWGALRFNVYLLLGWLFATGAAFLSPHYAASNTFLWTSLFLAFATLNPDFEFYILFVLPVRAKWLALVTAGFMVIEFALGDFGLRISVLASVANYLLFFGKDLARVVNRAGGASKPQARAVEEDEPRHRCRVCGKTERSHPYEDFRYCSKCHGEQCYCSEHLRQHDHIPHP